MPRDKRKIHAALDRLAREENRFLEAEFLAPVVGGGVVTVRIAGVVLQMKSRPERFRGFGVFRPSSHSEADLVREATLTERRRYLDLFPRVLLVVCTREATETLGVPLNAADARFNAEGELPIQLVEDAELFDTIAARFDGSHYWFDEVDWRSDPAAAPYLREALSTLVEPKKLDRPALAPGHRLAYLLNYQRRLKALVEDERTRGERLLREALEHAGARLRDFSEQAGAYRIQFEIDGRRHLSVVQKGSLTVQSSGICLSGRDRDFDLASLVGVLRESRGHF